MSIVTVPAPKKEMEVTMAGGTVTCEKRFRIKYVPKTETTTVVWRGQKDLSFSILSSGSGTGKTTFLNSLYLRLTWQAPYRPVVPPRSTFRLFGKRHSAQAYPPSPPLQFEFNPNFGTDLNISAAYIPQHAPKVKHWGVKNILPPKPEFLDVFFTDTAGISGKRIGQLSGGQRSKLYACSALERLAEVHADATFLLLDETFDGLGAAEAVRCIHAIDERWKSRVAKPLYILLVSHLNRADWTALTPLFVGFGVLKNEDDEMVVEVANN